MSRYFDNEDLEKKVSCRRCGVSGHSQRECKKHFEDFARCLVCGEQGHLSIHCPNREMYSSSAGSGGGGGRRNLEDFITERGAICVSCGEQDHVNCTLNDLDTSLAAETCARCGARGHTDIGCPVKVRPSSHGGGGGFAPRRSHGGGEDFDRARQRQYTAPHQRQSFPPLARHPAPPSHKPRYTAPPAHRLTPHRHVQHPPHYSRTSLPTASNPKRGRYSNNY